MIQMIKFLIQVTHAIILSTILIHLHLITVMNMAMIWMMTATIITPTVRNHQNKIMALPTMVTLDRTYIGIILEPLMITFPSLIDKIALLL